MKNKVELLRALCFTREDLESVKNLGDQFSSKEIDFMVEFKKIYELGLTQLEIFINKLDEEGKDLDVYSIKYYVNLLLNGPLGQHVRKLSQDKKYFSVISDMLGINGNNTRTTANTTLYNDLPVSLGCSVDMYNKLPKFLQENLSENVKSSEDLFRSNLYAFIIIDNTLPLVDKKIQDRYDKEPIGEWVNESIGNYMVKDSKFAMTLKDINEPLFNGILEYLGEDESRIFEDLKKYNPFDPEDNTSISSNFKVEKEVDEEVVIQDILGNVFDGVDQRNEALKVPTPEKDKEYKFHTNQGQLGI